MDYDDHFRLYMTSRLANPHFSPELAAKSTIIDFTVTQGGLEQQLLARLISKEQKQLEESLNQVQEEVTSNTKTLQSYEEQLLDKLASVQGSLLDDPEIIEVLATIKTKSKEVNEKLVEAAEKKIEINEKRELFRPAAARGAVLYFCVVEMTMVNWMYNTSLTQFLGLFDAAIEFSVKAQLVKERVLNIRTELTRRVYYYINRGLFERDKTSFKMMMCTKILIKDGKLTSADVSLFLKAGAGVDDRNKIFAWMTDKMWLNLKALSKHKFNNDHACFFKELPDRIQRNDTVWRNWIEENEPENTTVPDYEEKISADPNIGSFIHLCLVRSMREDRTMLACNMFIKDVLTEEYVKPVTDFIADIYDETKKNVPVLYLLSAGADPTGTIDEFAKKGQHKQFPTGKVSMGEEQEIPATALINASMITGKWVVLNNCHLSLEFMAQMEDILNPKEKVVHPDFRLWITCSPHDEFPLSLLQLAVKVTTEPPKGLQAGLSRTFNTVVNQDFLEKVEPYDKWRAAVYSICFMHSVVQERRKFGPLGFCIPYEFNNSDLIASLTFVEQHMT
jgi:dynein heavy chain